MKIRRAIARHIFLTLVIAAATATAPLACRREKPAPSIDQLTEALQHSADKALAVPSLANEQVTITASAAQLDAEAANVLAAATAAGGVSIRSLNANGDTSILATIPENNADAFKATVRHQKTLMNSPATATTLIEVIITKPGDIPSATPTP